MLVHRLLLFETVKTTLTQCIVCAGYYQLHAEVEEQKQSSKNICRSHPLGYSSYTSYLS